jgi:hypothetical protein
VERVQVEPLGGLCRDELHRRALHRVGDCLAIATVVRAASAKVKPAGPFCAINSSAARIKASLRLIDANFLDYPALLA